jgi:hypothetical protein
VALETNELARLADLVGLMGGPPSRARKLAS